MQEKVHLSTMHRLTKRGSVKIQAASALPIIAKLLETDSSRTTKTFPRVHRQQAMSPLRLIITTIQLAQTEALPVPKLQLIQLLKGTTTPTTSRGSPPNSPMGQLSSSFQLRKRSEVVTSASIALTIMASEVALRPRIMLRNQVALQMASQAALRR
jgi:hypothetical protein